MASLKEDHQRLSDFNMQDDETLSKTNQPQATETPEVQVAHSEPVVIERQFSLLSCCCVGIITGNCWSATGGSVVISLYNGGATGVIFEFLVVALFYWAVTASLAELASAIPSSAGVYKWASVTAGPRWGKPLGFFAGWWNFCAWIFAAAAMSVILGNQVVEMYALFHPDFVAHSWHTFIAFILSAWMCALVVIYMHHWLPFLNKLGVFIVVGGVLATIVTCSIMPSQTGSGYASSKFVWASWSNGTGYSSNGFVFLLGMLNGAFAIATPDCVPHLAEEIPRPQHNVPRAMAAQMLTSTITTFCFLVSIFYSITDMDQVTSATSFFPLAQIYRQATGSAGGALGLLLVIFIPCVWTTIGCYVTASRTLWTLGRGGATPFARFTGALNRRRRNPTNAVFCCVVINTCLGAIYVGSTTAFSAFANSFVSFGSLSYLAAIVPHLVGKRSRIPPGPFWMKGAVGYTVNMIASLYMAVFLVIYCFPFTDPFDATSMNWSSAMIAGFTAIIAGWWFWGGKNWETDIDEHISVAREAMTESSPK